MSKRLFDVLLALLLSLLGIIANAASFDCKFAHNRVEAWICADEAVSKLDEQLGAIYTQFRKTSNDEKREKAAQLAWLKARNACEDLACVKDAYASRIAELRARSAGASPSGMLVTSDSGAAQTAEHPKTTEESIKAIKAVLEKLGNDEAPSYKTGWADLDGDGRQEAIVLMTGADWCGTGGCTLMVLTQDGASWSIASRIPACRTPVVLLEAKTNGWRDLAVVTQGGGDAVRKITVLKFQRNGYVKHPETAVGNSRQIIIP